MRPRILLPLVVVASAWLLAFASWFDFLCDDAFIAFRYAENWVARGEISYNIGERIEGYTSFSWVALLALLHRLGISLPVAAKALGGISAVLLVVCTARYSARLMPGRPLGVVLLLAMVTGNACVAAWTLGGLETPLFTALVVASVVAAWDWLDQATPRRALIAAAVLFAATLTRPEGGLLAICIVLSVVVVAVKPRQVPRGTVAFVLGYALPCAGYILWRRSYYGDWLPNTFYVKTTGAGVALLGRGIEYLGFCATELGIPFVVAILLLAFLPTRRTVRHTDTGRVGAERSNTAGAGAARSNTAGADAQTTVGLRFAGITARLYAVATLLYVARIGGDFLDLYRFLVPLFPLIFGLALRRYFLLLENAPMVLRDRWMQSSLGIFFVAWYAHHQWAFAHRAMQLSEVARKEHGIEPLGWTATYARRWAATGRWLAAHSRSGDWLAVGAAGAMPFYSGLPNIDTFGLCDGYVARHGTIIGARPGHQRFAPVDYLLRRSPTFLLINDYALDDPARIRHDPTWDQRGYVWVEAHVDRDRYRAPNSFYHYFLVRKERAADLAGLPMTRVAGY